MTVQLCARFLCDLERLEIGISGPAKAEANETCCNGRIAMPIDQYETAGNLVVFVRVEADRLDSGDINKGDFIPMQFFSG